MANEQTTVPLFVAAEVLTATDMNLSAGTGTPVFLNSTTRDAGFGGAGEKVLAEGQLCYLSSTNVVQYYDGAAWATVGPSTAGLVCVKAETVFTTSAAVNVDSVFTSTYTNYLVHFSLASSATNDIGYYARLRASGTDTSSSNYFYGLTGATQAAGAVTGGGATQTSFNLGDIGSVFHLSQLTFGSPQVAARTTLYASSIEAATNGTSNRGIQTFGGFLDVATQYDGFTLYPSSGTITGSYIVYGYSKAV
jgi:hypothetical protein